MSDIAVYIHWPFCLSKCPYCDFASRAGAYDEDALLQGYLAEIAFYAEKIPARRVRSVYFGGGTPSLMKPATLARLLRGIEDVWALDPLVEVTLEANPATADQEKFRAFRAAGVNRLSLGVQSFRDDVLHFLGRAHDGRAAIDALDLGLRVFPRLSFDLIYAYAGQTLPMWEHDLTRAVRYGARHMSLYQLTLEARTPFAKRARAGEALTVSDDLAADLYDLTQSLMAAAGLPAYEISNHAKPGEESRHNLAYWHTEDYIGIGPAAHGRVPLYGGYAATRNHASPSAWLAQVKERGHGMAEREDLEEGARMTETVLMGLRLVEGLDSRAFESRFGRPLSAFLLLPAWRKLEALGLVETVPPFWRATAEGRQKLNAILEFILLPR